MHLYPSALLVLSLALNMGPAMSSPAPAPMPQSEEVYLTGYPLCAKPGYTEVPGNYTETTHQMSGATLTGCMDECRVDYTCGSIAYHARYTLCLWYDTCVEKTQLWEDDDSEFIHYDLDCNVP